MICYLPIESLALSLSSIQGYWKGCGSAIVRSSWLTKHERTIPVSISKTIFNINRVVESLQQYPGGLGWQRRYSACVTWPEFSFRHSWPHHTTQSSQQALWYSGLCPKVDCIRSAGPQTEGCDWSGYISKSQECRRDPCWGLHCFNCIVRR